MMRGLRHALFGSLGTLVPARVLAVLGPMPTTSPPCHPLQGQRWSCSVVTWVGRLLGSFIIWGKGILILDLISIFLNIVFLCPSDLNRQIYHTQRGVFYWANVSTLSYLDSPLGVPQGWRWSHSVSMRTDSSMSKAGLHGFALRWFSQWACMTEDCLSVLQPSS